MAINGKILSQGFISSSKETLYTVSDTRAYIKFLSVYNTSVTPQHVLLYVSGSLSTIFARVQLEIGEFAHVIDKDGTLMLETGNKIEAVTDTSNVIEYTISGGTE